MARRAKKATVEADLQPPVDPRVVFDKHMKLLTPLKGSLDDATDKRRTANSAWQTGLKAAKKDGINTEALCDALAIQKMDPEVVTKKFNDTNTYLKWLGAAVGTQFALGIDPETGKSVATAVEDENFERRPITTEKSISEARTTGFDAGHDGKSQSMNPFEDGSPEFLAWNEAWTQGQTAIARRMGKRHGAEATASA